MAGARHGRGEVVQDDRLRRGGALGHGPQRPHRRLGGPRGPVVLEPIGGAERPHEGHRHDVPLGPAAGAAVPPSAPPAHAVLQRAFCASERCFIWIWQAPQRPMHAPRATRAKADADARMGCALPRCCLTAHHKDSSACDAPPPPSMRSRRAPAGQQLCGAAHRSARRAQQPRDRAHAGVLRKEGIRL